MEPWWILLFLVFLASLLYINLLVEDRIVAPYRKQLRKDNSASVEEGFQDTKDIAGVYPENQGVIRWLPNDELYDSFYASIYDQLSQGAVRNQAEVGLMLHEWTKRGQDFKTFKILDAGCGTGVSAAAFAKMGVKKVVGIDKSPAMLTYARDHLLTQTTLTPEQKQAIEWREADLLNPSAAQGGEFTHAVLQYFTVYYFTDKETLFRNLFFWVAPGGRLAIHVVNKHKFDPMLESASPWLGFSLQKYAKDRVTHSEVSFNKFTYSADFDLHDPAAEFREVFRFKDGKIRRQRHTFKMEDMNTIVGMAKAAGWEYVGYTDLTPVGFEYAYHLHFKHS